MENNNNLEGQDDPFIRLNNINNISSNNSNDVTNNDDSSDEDYEDEDEDEEHDTSNFRISPILNYRGFIFQKDHKITLG